jgi:uncharacterized spore protein YtfJ
MTENLPTFVERGTTQLSQLLDKILAAARPGAVFSEPIHSGDYTIIMASEVTAAGGFGSGFGRGSGRGPQPSEVGEQGAKMDDEAGGGGLGGGGGSHGRPVAVIVIGPNGVRVRPVVDVTKIGIAAVTTWLAMFLMFRRWRRMRQQVAP